MKERISREELVQLYNIEIHFFDELHEYGLLHIIEENNIKYLLYEELPMFEKFANWHYDLEVNIPGLEIIHQMLLKMEALQNENRRLLNRMISAPQGEDYLD